MPSHAAGFEARLHGKDHKSHRPLTSREATNY